MSDLSLPTTVTDFVTAKLAELPAAARLVVVFDPYADLALPETFEVEATHRAWRVLRYDGNDLAFRQQQGRQPGQSDLVWVTAPPGARRDGATRLDLRSMMDVWRRAEAFIDASLPGVLRQLAPETTWPDLPIWEQAPILSQNLPAVVSGWRNLRRRLEQPASLDTHTIRALALHCLQPTLSPEQFMFRLDTPTRVLTTYLNLLWGVDWQLDSLSLLQQQAREAPKVALGADIEAWLNLSIPTLALYLYLRRWLGRFRLPNIANQLRGLGLLDVNTEALETQVDHVLLHWERDLTWRKRVIRQAEEVLTQEDIQRVISLLNLNTPEDILTTLNNADTPATIYAMQIEFCRQTLTSQRAEQHTPGWIEHRPVTIGDLPDTSFKAEVLKMAAILDEIAFVDSGLSLSPPTRADIVHLLDWYIESKLYDLEYAQARAKSQLLYLNDEKLRQRLEPYVDQQKQRIKAFLDKLDHTLAELITTNWPGYLNHPRLATNVLWDTVKKSRLSVTSQTRLWVVVFDGMRWDTWANHVKPRLLETFELVKPEKPYLSLLPSWTMVARTGLLAGKPPEAWRDENRRLSRDQGKWVAQLFNIPPKEKSRQLQFFSNMESERKYGQLHSDERYPYNVLVFNISDDNLHSQHGSLSALNKEVDSQLDDILQKLKLLVKPEDTLVISSDHGFVELEPGQEIVIPDNQRWTRFQSGEAQHPVRYRYLTTHDVRVDPTCMYQVNYRDVADQFTVAIGRRWFKRADSRGPEDHYAHGGLSLAEMVVPGAMLKLITQRKVQPALTTQPTTLEIREKETAELIILVANKGNVMLNGQLTAQADTAGEPTHYPITLPPGEERQVVYPVTAFYQKRSDKTILSTQQVNLTFSYTDLEGQPKKKPLKVPVKVLPRTDIVEIDFGGLPDLDM